MLATYIPFPAKRRIFLSRNSVVLGKFRPVPPGNPLALFEHNLILVPNWFPMSRSKLVLTGKRLSELRRALAKFRLRVRIMFNLAQSKFSRGTRFQLDLELVLVSVKLKLKPITCGDPRARFTILWTWLNFLGCRLSPKRQIYRL